MYYGIPDQFHPYGRFKRVLNNVGKAISFYSAIDRGRSNSVFNMAPAMKKRKRSDSKIKKVRKTKKKTLLISDKPYWKSYKKHGKKKNARPQVEAVHGEVKRHRCSILVGKKKSIKNPGKGKWRITDQSSGTASSLEGQQAVGYLGFIGTKSQILDSSGSGYNQANQAYTSLFDTNPFQTNTGGVLYGNTVAPLDDRIVLQSVVYNLEMANFTTGSPLIIDLYWLKCMKNTSDDPQTIWQNVLISQALGKAGAVQGAASGYPLISQVGTRPEEAPAFRKIWKTLKKETYELASGANVQLLYTMKFNKMIDKKTIVEQPTPFIAGFTVTPWVIIRGCIGKDVDGAGVTIAPVELGYVISREYQCFVPSANRLQTQFMSANLYTGGSGVNVVNVIDDIANVQNL